MQKIIEQLIGLLDFHINQALNRILHHPRFQKLESSWRGLSFLINTVTDGNDVILRLLNLKQQVLSNDLNQTNDIEQSQLFQKIYTTELDQAGGTPYGLLVLDYYYSHKINKKHDNIHQINMLATLASLSFCPLVVGVCPSLFGLNAYDALPSTLNLQQLFTQQEYTRWNTLRRNENTCYIGLLFPCFRIRPPYGENNTEKQHRSFKEHTHLPNDYLWANAVYLYASTIIQRFQHTAWFSSTPPWSTKSLPHKPHRSRHFNMPLIAKPLCTQLLSEKQQYHLAQLGVMSLHDDIFSEDITLYFNHSLYNSASCNKHPKSFPILFDHILCCSRFMHYIKIILRDKIGSFLNEADCENYLQHWINQYCDNNQQLANIQRYPLSEADVNVTLVASQKNTYHCSLAIKLHPTCQQIYAKLRFIHEIKSV